MIIPDRYADTDARPLRVIARPPQTPYDFVITVARPEPPGGGDIPWYDGAYVRGREGVPVGRIEGKYGDTYLVILFSSPSSEELFSVGGAYRRRDGYRRGRFLSADTAGRRYSGRYADHASDDGENGGKVTAIETFPEKHTQLVKSVIAVNPTDLSVLFVENESARAVPESETDRILEMLRKRSENITEE